MSVDSKTNLERLEELLKRRKELKEDSPPEESILEELGLKEAPKEKKNKTKEQHRQTGGRKIKPKR